MILFLHTPPPLPNIKVTLTTPFLFAFFFSHLVCRRLMDALTVRFHILMFLFSSSVARQNSVGGACILLTQNLACLYTYIYIYIYIRAHTHTHTHIYICTYIHVHIAYAYDIFRAMSSSGSFPSLTIHRGTYGQFAGCSTYSSDPECPITVHKSPVLVPVLSQMYPFHSISIDPF